MSSWVRQTITEPAFPDIQWSRPERRDQAGKLLIVGGNQHGFSAPAEAFAAANKAGVGVSRVLLPNKLQKTVSKLFPPAEFGTSTPSGSFSTAALGELLEIAAWADGTLLAGDFGHNSETAVLLEAFLTKHSGQVTIVQDAAEYFISASQTVIDRADTLLVLNMAQLQKLATHAHFTPAITQSMDLLQLIEALHQFSELHSCYIVVKHLDNLLVAVDGQVSTTKIPSSTDAWRVATAAQTSVWWLQHPTQPFQALTTAITAKHA